MIANLRSIFNLLVFNNLIYWCQFLYLLMPNFKLVHLISLPCKWRVVFWLAFAINCLDTLFLLLFAYVIHFSLFLSFKVLQPPRLSSFCHYVCFLIEVNELSMWLPIWTQSIDNNMGNGFIIMRIYTLLPHEPCHNMWPAVPRVKRCI